MKVDVESLLRLPYAFGGTDRATGVDCRWTARTVLEMVFPDLQPHEMPTTSSEEDVAISVSRLGMSRWHKVGASAACATRLGDVIYGQVDGRSFVAVLIDSKGRVAITAVPDHGVCRIAARRIQGVTAVYRRSVK